MTRFLAGWIVVSVLVATTAVASAQTAPAKPEDEPKTPAYAAYDCSKAQDTITVAPHYLLF